MIANAIIPGVAVVAILCAVVGMLRDRLILCFVAVVLFAGLLAAGVQ